MEPSPEALLRFKQQNRVTWASVAKHFGLPSADAARCRVSRAQRSGKLRAIKPLEPLPPELQEVEIPDEFTLEEALSIADRLQELMEFIDPIVTSAELHFPPEPMAIMWSSCAHIGGRYTFHPLVRETFDKVMETDGLYLADLGDETEGFLPGFRDAAAVVNQVLPIPVQEKILSLYLQQWSEAGKILFGCSSQHGGQWYERMVGFNPIKQEFHATKTPYFDGRGIVKLWVGDERYIITAAHNFKGSSIYNKNHPQRRATLFDYPSADVAAMGDKHSYSVQHMADRVDEYLEDLRPTPYVWHVQVGTAKVGADPYTVRGWQHGWFEWPVLVFYPDRHVIKQCYELSDLKWMLQG